MYEIRVYNSYDVCIFNSYDKIVVAYEINL
jgi:hypothetical protein